MDRPVTKAQLISVEDGQGAHFFTAQDVRSVIEKANAWIIDLITTAPDPTTIAIRGMQLTGGGAGRVYCLHFVTVNDATPDDTDDQVPLLTTTGQSASFYGGSSKLGGSAVPEANGGNPGTLRELVVRQSTDIPLDFEVYEIDVSVGGNGATLGVVLLALLSPPALLETLDELNAARRAADRRPIVVREPEPEPEE